jgi:ethanolamine utilization protein EutN
MKLGRVIGNVVTVREVSSYTGKKLLLVQEIDEQDNSIGDPLVAVDTVDAGNDCKVFFVTARDAAFVFPDNPTPVDAAIIGIVEDVR